MGVRSKTLVVVLLVGLVFGVFALSTRNSQLFKGQIFDGPGNEITEETGDVLLPDLTVNAEIIFPEIADDDIEIDVTMENIGEGTIPGGTPYTYTIYINDTEVFSNSDSYSELAPGDAFSFKYPISKTIYQYPNEGTVKVVVDGENSIKESNEGNNEIIKDYKL
ncbi:MAG: CARDB domain-containing protein [Nitrospirota bacterium]